MKETLEVICSAEKFKVRKVELENVDTHKKEMIDVDKGTITEMKDPCSQKVHSTLLVQCCLP